MTRLKQSPALQQAGSALSIFQKKSPYAAREEETKLLQLVEKFSQGQKAGTVQFKEVSNFNGKVLFLKPEKNLFLSEINNALPLLLPEFEKAEKVAKQITLPLEAAIEELAVYQCSSFLELKKYKLKA